MRWKTLLASIFGQTHAVVSAPRGPSVAKDRVLVGLSLDGKAAAAKDALSVTLRSTYLTQHVVPKTNIMVWKPLSNGLATYSATQWKRGVGQAWGLTIELEDDFDAVQLVFANNLLTPWTLTQAVVSSSSQYGDSPNVPGLQPYDGEGDAVATLLPVTFNSKGADASPVSGALSSYSGLETSGAYVLALQTNAEANAGASTLSFSTLETSKITGGLKPSVNMYVSDGLSSIPPDTKIIQCDGNTIRLSAHLKGPIANGQQVWFSWVPLTLSLTVPASTNPPANQEVYSDWLPLSSVPRLDGGMQVGTTVGGSGIASGTTVAAVCPTSVTLSLGITGAVSQGQPIGFSTTTTTRSVSLANGFAIDVANTAGLIVGQFIAGTNVPVGAQITQVGDRMIRLSAVIVTSIPAGTTIIATTTAYVNAAVPAGATSLPFVSTSGKRLLTMRGWATGDGGVGGYWVRDHAPYVEQALGLPLYSGYVCHNNALDPVNVPTTNGFQIWHHFPVYAVRYLSRRPGIHVAVSGDSHYAGDGTTSGMANFVRRACAEASTPTVPVSFASLAYGGHNGNRYFDMANRWVRNSQPSIVIVQGWSFNGGDWLGSYQFRVQAPCSLRAQLWRKN